MPGARTGSTGQVVPGRGVTLHNSASVRKYVVEIPVWIRLLTGSHLVKYHCYLGSRLVRFFHGVPLSKQWVSFSNLGTVRGPTQ